MSITRSISVAQTDDRVLKAGSPRDNSRSVNCSIGIVSEVHGPYELYGPSKRYLPLITSVKYSNTH